MAKTKKSGLRLRIDFTYDHTSGLYYANLENGAIIPVSRNDVGGKLENTLNLFRRAVIAIEHPDQSRPGTDTNKDADLIREAEALGMVQVVGVVKPAEVDLSLLDIDLDLIEE